MNVTDLIGQDYKQWKVNDIITIKAGTGKGKSHFIKNTLYEHAKENNLKILMLIHRINCVDQFQMEIERENKTDVIHIKTYQSLEHKSKKSINLSDYNIIVSDEFHYFMSDAAFNVKTDKSLNKILEHDNCIKVFMSATGDKMNTYLTNKLNVNIIKYEMPLQYEHINNLSFFSKDQSFELLAKKFLEEGTKCIFFVQSSTKAYELYKQFKKHSLFNCGKSDRHYRYVKKDKIKDMLYNEYFEEQFLFTTTCMDSGVNIKDDQLKSIVCEIDDTGTLIQCIGRKRMINENDRVNVFLKYINPFRLGGMETNINNKLNKARFLVNHSVNEYIERYGRDKDFSYIVHDVPIEGESDISTKKINELLYHKCLTDLVEIQTIKNYDKYGYSEYITNLLGKFDYKLIEKDLLYMELEEYIDSIIGDVMLTRKDRSELIKRMDIKQNGKLLKSIDSLNAALKEKNMDYYIKEFETSRIVNGKKRKYKSAWKVLRLSEE